MPLSLWCLLNSAQRPLAFASLLLGVGLLAFRGTCIRGPRWNLKTQRGDVALVVSRRGATRNPKVGPNEINARAKSVIDVKTALICFLSRVAISNSYFVVGPGTSNPRCFE